MMRSTLLGVSLLLLPAAAAVAQTKIDFPAGSPACELKQRVGLADIEIDYSRPSAHGRKMLGGIDPYGQVWRTGANDATRIIFSAPVKLNGNPVEAGTYALFTIPEKDEWTIILSKASKQWGAYKYDAKDDVLRFKAKTAHMAQVETFTIEFTDFAAKSLTSSATLNLMWEHTRVEIGVESDLSPVVAQIDAVMNSDAAKKPYFAAAQFYYDAGLEPKKALGWIEAAIAQKPAFNLATLRGKLLVRAGEKEAAIEQAKDAIEMAKKIPDPAGSEYVRINEETIRQAKAI